jgi:hypothetical protein
MKPGFSKGAETTGGLGSRGRTHKKELLHGHWHC